MDKPRKKCRLVEKSAGRAPSLHIIPWHLPYNWGKSRKTSVRVAEAMVVGDPNVICLIQGISPYRAVNTFHHGYKNESVNGMKQRSLSVLRSPQHTKRKASTM